MRPPVTTVCPSSFLFPYKTTREGMIAGDSAVPIRCSQTWGNAHAKIVTKTPTTPTTARTKAMDWLRVRARHRCLTPCECCQQTFTPTRTERWHRIPLLVTPSHIVLVDRSDGGECRDSSLSKFLPPRLARANMRGQRNNAVAEKPKPAVVAGFGEGGSQNGGPSGTRTHDAGIITLGRPT